MQSESRQSQARVSDLLALLEALEEVMQPAQYLEALLSLLQNPTDVLAPRIIRLFEASLSKATDPRSAQAALQFCSQVGFYKHSSCLIKAAP